MYVCMYVYRTKQEVNGYLLLALPTYSTWNRIYETVRCPSVCLSEFSILPQVWSRSYTYRVKIVASLKMSCSFSGSLLCFYFALYFVFSSGMLNKYDDDNAENVDTSV